MKTTRLLWLWMPLSAVLTGCKPAATPDQQSGKKEPTAASEAVNYVTGRTQVDALNKAKKEAAKAEEIRERQMKEVLEDN